MLTFYRKYIGDILIKEIGEKARQCKLCEVTRENTLIGKFYSGDNYSFIELPDVKIRIERKRKFLRKGEYSIFNQFTGEYMGKYDFPSAEWFGITRCILSLENNIVYSFTQNNDHRSILKPNTWNEFRFDMNNSSNYISYFGKMYPGVTDNINKDQIFTGKIELTNLSTLVPVMAGIFIIEEKFRIMEETPS